MLMQKENNLVLTRRTALAIVTGVVVPCLPAFAQTGDTKKATGQLTEAQRYMLTSLPVLPWLSIKETTVSSVQAQVQAIVTSHPGIIQQWSDSEITGGPSLPVNSLVGDGLLGEKGLRIFSLHFDSSRRLELVIFMVERSWNEKNVAPLIERVTKRYARYASPILIANGHEEATDKYLVYDIGRFVIEIGLPQYSTFVPVYFTTKKTHKMMRQTDNTYNQFEPYLEKTVKTD